MAGEPELSLWSRFVLVSLILLLRGGAVLLFSLCISMVLVKITKYIRTTKQQLFPTLWPESRSSAYGVILLVFLICFCCWPVCLVVLMCFNGVGEKSKNIRTTNKTATKKTRDVRHYGPQSSDSGGLRGVIEGASAEKHPCISRQIIIHLLTQLGQPLLRAINT